MAAGCHFGVAKNDIKTRCGLTMASWPPAHEEDIWNSGWVMAIFLFPKWRPAAILDFVTGQKWRNGRLRTVHVYHHAKFGDNTSNGGRVIAIFRFSKWPPAAILDFSVAQNDIKTRCGLTMATSTLNLVKISVIAADLRRFSFFQNGGQPPSWIWLNRLIGPPTITPWRS